MAVRVPDYWQALEASEELRESLELEHKEVGQFIAAWYAGDVSRQASHPSQGSVGFQTHYQNARKRLA